MNTTIYFSQGQNKTKPLLEKQLLQPLFNTQAFGVFMQKSQNFPLQEVPGRKLVPWSSATPQTRKKQRQHRHLFSRTATASQNRKQDPEAAEALVSCEGFLGRLRSDEPFTLHFWGKMVGLGPHFNQDPTMKPAEDLNGVVGISWLLVTPTQLTIVLILEPCGN